MMVVMPTFTQRQQGNGDAHTWAMSVRSRIKRINLGENDNWEAMRDRLESS
jgi:hypothetical protein